MALTVRKTGQRAEYDAQWQLIASLSLLVGFGTFVAAQAIGNGTTAGRLRTNASYTGRIAGLEVTKASTDNLWNLAAETNTTSTQFRAYWLYLDASGTASFARGANASSAALALAALPAHDETKTIAGVYVAGVSTDFDAVGGLAAQGTIYNGIPEGVPIGVPRKTYIKPPVVALIAP